MDINTGRDLPNREWVTLGEIARWRGTSYAAVQAAARRGTLQTRVAYETPGSGRKTYLVRREWALKWAAEAAANSRRGKGRVQEDEPSRVNPRRTVAIA